MYDPQIDDETVPEYQSIVESDPTLRFGKRSIEGVISTSSTAFHFIDASVMYEIHDYLYQCPTACKAEFLEHFGADYYDSKERQKIISSKDKKRARYQRN